MSDHEGGFDTCLSNELASLECRLTAEHGRELQALRQKVFRLEGENSLLRQELRSLAPESTDVVWASYATEEFTADQSPSAEKDCRSSISTKAVSRTKEGAENEQGSTLPIRLTAACASLGIEDGLQPPSTSGIRSEPLSGVKSEPCPPGVPLPNCEPPQLLKAETTALPGRTSRASSMQSSQLEQKRTSQCSHNSAGTSVDAGFELLPEWRMDAKRTQRRRSNSVFALMPAQHGELLCGHGTINVQDEDSILQSIMMQPSSITHLCWGCVGLALILFDVVIIPLEFLEPKETPFTTTMWWIIRIFWTLDIGRAFVTGRFGSNGELEMRFRKVAILYAKSWRLPVDLLTVLCDWVILLQSNTSGATLTSLWLTRFVRIIRLLRVAKISEIENFIAEYISTESGALIVQMLKMMLVLVVTAHIIACIWYKVGTSAGDSITPAGWVVHFGLQDAELGYRYAWAFHWSLAQFTGENVFAPQNHTERSFAVCVLLITFVLSALFVSSVTTSMTRLTIVAGKQPLQLVALRRYLFDQRISTSLLVRMQRNAQQALLEKKRAPPELLAQISEPLRTEFHFELHSPALLQHPFLLYYHETNPACIRTLCHVAISPLPLLRGDIIFSENETPAHPRMLFLTSVGMLTYHVNGEQPQVLSGGQWMCEAVLWTTWVHCGTLVSEAHCKLLQLDAEKFRTIMSRIPTRDASKYGSAYIQKLNRVDRARLSDIWMPDYEDIMSNALPLARHLLRWSSRRLSTASGSSKMPGMPGSPLAVRARSGSFSQSTIRSNTQKVSDEGTDTDPLYQSQTSLE